MIARPSAWLFSREASLSNSVSLQSLLLPVIRVLAGVVRLYAAENKLIRFQVLVYLLSGTAVRYKLIAYETVEWRCSFSDAQI